MANIPVQQSKRVDTDKAKAKFKDGILKLTLPKVEKAHRQTIKVD